MFPKNMILPIVEIEEIKTNLTDEEFIELFNIVLEYYKGNEIKSDKPIVNMSFSLLKFKIKSDIEKYRKTCEKNKQNGAKGGRPPKKDNNKTNKDLNKNKTEVKHKYGDNMKVLLTNSEYQKTLEKYKTEKYCKEAIQVLDDYIATSGRSYKSHYLVLTTKNSWVLKKMRENYSNGSSYVEPEYEEAEIRKENVNPNVNALDLLEGAYDND